LLSFTTILVFVFAALLTRAQQKVREHAEHARLIEARSAVILDTAPAALVLADTKGIVTYYNPQAEQLFGWTCSEIVGQPIHRLLSQETAKRHAARFEQAVHHIREHEGAWQFTRRVTGVAVTKTGDEVPVIAIVRGIKYNGFIEFAAVIYPEEAAKDESSEARRWRPSRVGRTLPNAFTQASQQQQ